MNSTREIIFPQASGGLSPGPSEAPISGREKVVRSVNQALTRLDLILSILEKLNESLLSPPGDSDLRHGCERAITSILCALAKIEPAEPSSSPPGRQEKAVRAALNGERLSRLIDADRHGCLCSLIDRLLPGGSFFR